MVELPTATDIVIVGAGPSGLALACALQQLGIAAVVLDKQLEGANTSRAAVIHARTLEVLTPLDVVPTLLNQGITVPRFRVRDRDRLLLTVNFSQLNTPYPFTLMCPQNQMEATLLSRLEKLGGQVVRPAEVKELQRGPNEIAVRVASRDSVHTITAKWVVGSDGMHSIVRESAGIAFEGASYNEDFVLADVHMDWPLTREEVNLFFSPRGLVVVAPLPEDRFRIVATAATASEHPPMEFFQGILDDRGPSDRHRQASIRNVVWSSRFRVQHRVAATLREDCVILCGDAAHVHSPAGGQGMNTGIQDAVSLAHPLATALRTGDYQLLVDWTAARHRVATEIVRLTDRMTRAATLSQPVARICRNLLLRFVDHVPAARNALSRTLSEINNP
jgi:2-polyprenyl-6-methoxyphenol hydroxylase-like FAD-dependent oxidoreductase